MTIVAQLGQVPTLTQYDETGNPTVSVTANAPLKEGDQVFPLAAATRYFVQFADPTQDSYSWNRYAGKADDMFVAERLAMYIGYSGEMTALRARNPRGDYEMSYFPQTRGYPNFVTGMRMYGIATLKTTRNLPVATKVQYDLSGGVYSPSIASITGGVPALRAYSGTSGLHQVIARSMLVARGWNDSHPEESNGYIVAMLSDILNYRYGVNDAVNMFVGRLRDLYRAY
jgi:hypothetical protein